MVLGPRNPRSLLLSNALLRDFYKRNFELVTREYIFARLKNEGWPFLTLDKGHPGSENTQVGPALDCPEESSAILLASPLSVFSYLSYI